MHIKRDLLLLAFLLGLFETMSQVVLIRELLVAFTGNELTIATVLAIWLITVSLGSMAAGRGRAPRAGSGGLAALFIIAGVLALFQVILVRFLRPDLASAGEVLGPSLTVALTAAGVCPSAFALGALFVGLVRFGAERSHSSPLAATYGGEALGAGLAGFLLSLWLLEAATPVAIAAAGTGIGALAALLTVRAAARRPRLALTASAVATLALSAAVLAYSPRIDLDSRGAEFSPFKVVRSEDTKYGNIVVAERGELHDFYESGAFAFTIVDPMFAEETVHIPMLYHARPVDVLIVGSSGSGVIREALKHPSVKRVVFVEMDPAIIYLSRIYAPPGYMGQEGVDAWPVLGDARAYVARAAPSYDVIILATGLPLSLQINRLYTVEFFRAARRALAPGGLIGLSIASEGAYIGPEQAGLIISLANAMASVFEHVDILPGDTIHITASDSPLAGRRRDLASAMAARALDTAYINAFVLEDRLAPLRTAQLDSVLAMYNHGEVNSDARPVAFSCALAVWAKQFGTGRALDWVTARLGLGTSALMLAAAAAAVIALFALAAGAGAAAAPPLACLYSSGFTTMFTTVMLMLCFQISRGYVYTRLAILIAAFMLGLGLTATLLGRRMARAPERTSLTLLQAAMTSLPLLVLAAFGAARSPGGLFAGSAGDAVYILLALAAGAAGAGVFAASSGALARRGIEATRAGALAYSIDLIGASLAGFTTGFLTIPALGLSGAAMAVSLVNFFILGGLQFATRPYRRPPAR
jgi:spermidine synthase